MYSFVAVVIICFLAYSHKVFNPNNGNKLDLRGGEEVYKFHNEVRENSDEKNMGGVTKNDSVTSSFVLFSTL